MSAAHPAGTDREPEGPSGPACCAQQDTAGQGPGSSREAPRPALHSPSTCRGPCCVQPHGPACYCCRSSGDGRTAGEVRTPAGGFTHAVAGRAEGRPRIRAADPAFYTDYLPTYLPMCTTAPHIHHRCPRASSHPPSTVPTDEQDAGRHVHCLLEQLPQLGLALAAHAAHNLGRAHLRAAVGGGAF